MANEVTHIIGPGPRTLASFGDSPVNLTFGNDQVSLESGGVVVAQNASDDSAITADADGHIYLRAGTVLVKKTGSSVWQKADSVADADTDGAADQIADAQAVGILKATVDLASGAAPVGIWIAGGFFGERLPKVADNTAIGIEATVKAALAARGFRFAEDYH
jgi:hypothetical protein